MTPKKTVQNLEWAQETMKVPQPPKRMPRPCQTGMKMDSSWLSQLSQNEEKLGISNISLPFFPDCISTHVNQPRRVQEAGITDLENQMQQAEFASCHLINVELAINSLLLKEIGKMKI